MSPRFPAANIFKCVYFPESEKNWRTAFSFQKLKNEKVPKKDQNHDTQKRQDPDEKGFLPIPLDTLNLLAHRGHPYGFPRLPVRAAVRGKAFFDPVLPPAGTADGFLAMGARLEPDGIKGQGGVADSAALGIADGRGVFFHEFGQNSLRAG
jgi:hypothetical protein